MPEMRALANGAAGEHLAGVGTAAACQASHSHSPKPLRFVWHHVLPKTCGGQTTAGNLVSLCDNCHYGVHAILFDLKLTGGVGGPYTHLKASGRYAIALDGYQQAVAAGTVGNIPNEGSD